MMRTVLNVMKFLNIWRKLMVMQIYMVRHPRGYVLCISKNNGIRGYVATAPICFS